MKVTLNNTSKTHFNHLTFTKFYYSSPNIIRMTKSRRMRWAGRVTCIGEKRTAYRILMGKPERNRPLGKHRSVWKDNTKMDLRETAWSSMDTICSRIRTSGLLL
jgi:hypothetical protein